MRETALAAAFVLALAAMAGSVGTASGRQQAGKPLNVVLVVIDDARWDALGRTVCSHPEGGGSRELPFRLESQPLLHEGTLVAVDDVPGVGQLWREVPAVEKPVVRRGAHQVVLDVHSVARGEDERRRRSGFGSDEHSAGQMRRNFHSGTRRPES